MVAFTFGAAREVRPRTAATFALVLGEGFFFAGSGSADCCQPRMVSRISGVIGGGVSPIS
ncbi:hypothetical protein B0I31_106124 [Saccharothrix carnea]|uniref:Uncharacterized protein n=1 Tax=Saccharothrix carnea TaxID=1280637 RepID=A0A2P8I848_SACCR|nr:hypothetical protein B0I31_106124 [Saccharothrix carnea]